GGVGRQDLEGLMLFGSGGPQGEAGSPCRRPPSAVRRKLPPRLSVLEDLTMLYLEDLLQISEGGCQEAGCDHQHHGTLYFHGTCHSGGAVEISFAPGSDHVLVACRECHKPIARIAVAWRNPVEAC